jgi:hypothetical protein
LTLLGDGVAGRNRWDEYADTWGLLFDAGGDARANGIPFDEERTLPWKDGWIDTDVNLGAHGRCGDAKILALGLCSTCYTLKRQDEEYFGGYADRYRPA